MALCSQATSADSQDRLRTKLRAALKSMSSELMCAVCLCEAEDAHSLPCLHTYCKNCIEHAFKTRTECPQCKHPCYRRDIRPHPGQNNLKSIYEALNSAVEALEERAEDGDGGAGLPSPKKRGRMSAPDPRTAVDRVASAQPALGLGMDVPALMAEKEANDRRLQEINDFLRAVGRPELAAPHRIVAPPPPRPQQPSAVSSHAATFAPRPLRKSSSSCPPPQPASVPSRPGASPNELRRSPSVVFELMGTGLEKNQVQQLRQLANMLNKSNVHSGQSKTVTHLITDARGRSPCTRSDSYTCGVLLGQWVLTFEWVTASLREGFAVNEEDYEVQGDHHAQWGARKARTALSNGEPPLFSGLVAMPHGRADRVKTLKNLLKWGGATVPKTSLSKSRRTGTSYAVVEQMDINQLEQSDLRELKSAGYTVVSADWLYDSVSHYEMQDTSKHLITTEMVRRGGR